MYQLLVLQTRRHIIGAAPQQQNYICIFAFQHFQMLILNGRIIKGITQNRIITTGNGSRFNSYIDSGIKRVTYIRQQHTNRFGIFIGKPLCYCIGHKLVLLYQLHYTISFFFFHMGAIIQHTRNGSRRHTCLSCKVINGYRSTFHPDPIPAKILFLLYLKPISNPYSAYHDCFAL